MEIDIIAYSDLQLATLPADLVLKVQEAQVKKNRLERRYNEACMKEKMRLVSNGTFLSEIWEKHCEALKKAYDEEVNAIREGLLFLLRFIQKAEGETALYIVDYALTMEERYAVVKAYYENAYEDPQKRFDAFEKDEVAKAYLGEYYLTLFHYLSALVK